MAECKNCRFWVIDDAVVTTLVSFLVPPPAFTPVHTSEIPEQYQDL